MLAFISNLTKFVNSVNNSTGAIKPVTVTQGALNGLNDNLPSLTSLSPTPVIIPIQMVVALATVMTPRKRKYYTRSSYAHTYNPRIS